MATLRLCSDGRALLYRSHILAVMDAIWAGLLGALAGGVFTLLGVAIQARSARRTTERSTAAQVAAAEFQVQRQTDAQLDLLWFEYYLQTSLAFLAQGAQCWAGGTRTDEALRAYRGWIGVGLHTAFDASAHTLMLEIDALLQASSIDETELHRRHSQLTDQIQSRLLTMFRSAIATPAKD